LYYLQEPSSMAVAEAVRPEPGWSVVDLAAAPGGKTTHLASLVGPAGVVVANEVVGSRLRPLHDNLDLWGARSVVTTSTTLNRLEGASFDAAILDAPCSGEGLFRRNPDSIRQWSPDIVRGSAKRQARLLADAARLVRPDGVLVYSTCTFAVEENEERVAEFLAEVPGWELEEVHADGFAAGVSLPPAPTERTVRLWPHRVAGEGQFFARLRRVGDGRVPALASEKVRDRSSTSSDVTRRQRARSRRVPAAEVRAAWWEFHARTVPGLEAPAERILVREDRVFLLPERPPVVPVDRLARPGLPLGRLRPGRFEPHPALACALTPDEVGLVVSWPLGSPELAAYLHGETVPSDGPDGWVLICFERWGLGWAKRTQGVLKNMFPAHLRQVSSPRPSEPTPRG
jgi:NOL1/NOP2/fmu family ribosome biogenesis protein